MSIMLYRVCREDLPALVELRRQALHEVCGRRYGPDVLEAYARRCAEIDMARVELGRVLALKDERTPVAVACWSAVTDRPGLVELDGLAVHPAYAGRHLGARLVAEIETEAAVLGAESVEVAAGD